MRATHRRGILACLFGMLAVFAPIAAMAGVRPTGAWVFDRVADYPGVTMMRVDRTGHGLEGRLTSRWYGDIAMRNVALHGRTLHFDTRNINDRDRPTRHWTATFDPAGGVLLKGGIWHGDIAQHGRRGTPRNVRTLTFRPAAPLPPLATLPPDDLAATPPMGWSSWNRFADKIDDSTIRAMADALVDSGLRDAGYLYVNIDDGWQGVRGPDGVLRPNERFPDMKALADYVHAKGLKLGLYTSPGPRTCAGYEGSYGHVAQDARTFADWGVDYVKHDLCSGEWFYDTAEGVKQAYLAMGQALRATGRPILYSLCEYGRFDVANWGRSVGGHVWRTTGDITDDYKTMSDIGFERNPRFPHAGPGGWNDPDMLEVGNGGMSRDEYRTHMTLWAMQAAPLIMGHDLRHMTDETRDLLAMPTLIAIDQDRLGEQGRRVRRADGVEIWRKRLADGAVAVAMFNRTTDPQSAVSMPDDSGLVGPVRVRDLFANRNLDQGGGALTIAPHGVVLLRVEPVMASR
ncbi:glycoside hydrolase family 27 protein [Sphingomonas sanguinis]|uniref:glycoside hydrolase family 27 protein n=1 Tax=Sphingomonas sp. LC-1 TaxID=3110957 RepID=UPI0021BA9341|nr:glycoside hydrolase family 27 protein [Sphingomonas sp. LC-1]MCT8003112.1 glycoside hydrolase family 27 protein [Sphingomonas sp. LC-1]